MKEAVGGSWITGIVVVFVILFASFMAISINWSKSYKVKDEILAVIERNHGMKKSTITEINGYLADVGYRNVGQCPKNDGCWYGFNYNNNDSAVNSNPNYCVKKTIINASAIGHPTMAYYTVDVFFRLDIPIIGDIIKLDLSGETSTIMATDTLIKETKC